MTLEGIEVLLFQPDFASAPKLVGSQKIDEAALGQNRVQAFVSDRPLHSFTHRFKFASRTDAAILEDFFAARAGSWQPFWLPSWHGELNPVASITSGGNQLSITPVDYATNYDPTDANVAKLGHYIFLVHYDGTVLIRKVTSVSGTTPEVLTLDSAVPQDFELGRFVVGFVYCVTTINDKLTFEFNGIDSCSTEIAFTEEHSIDDAEADEVTPTIEERLVADFSSDVSSGDPPLTVNFTDESTGTPIAWLWNFGDGTATSTDQNPEHEFTESGNYQVRLRVRDASGNTSFITREIVVNAEAIPPAIALSSDFSLTPSSGDAALAVAFTDESTGTPTVWAWAFGDGSYSGEQNPNHTYQFPGTYTISLDIRDTNGATSRKVDTITVSEATAVTVTCDSGANYDNGTYYIGTSCAGCCTALDAMNVDDIAVWTNHALENCLGLTIADGMTFEFNSKTFAVAYDYVNNTNGSYNMEGNVFYDVVRID